MTSAHLARRLDWPEVVDVWHRVVVAQCRLNADTPQALADALLELERAVEGLRRAIRHIEIELDHRTGVQLELGTHWP